MTFIYALVFLVGCAVAAPPKDKSPMTCYDSTAKRQAYTAISKADGCAWVATLKEEDTVNKVQDLIDCINKRFGMTTYGKLPLKNLEDYIRSSYKPEHADQIWPVVKKCFKDQPETTIVSMFDKCINEGILPICDLRKCLKTDTGKMSLEC